MVAIGLDVAEGVRALVEDDVELALLDPLIEPGAAEDEAADPVDEALLGAADELDPVRVDVLAEGGGRVADLAVDRELDEVVELLGPRPGWVKSSFTAACSTRWEKSASLNEKRSSPYSRT